MIEKCQYELESPARRRFLVGAAAAATTSLVTAFAPPAMASDFWNLPRSLWIIHADSGEELRTTYFADGKLIWSNYLALCQLMRDRRADVAAYMDPALLDVFRGVQGWFEGHGIIKPLYLLSGYRTLRTNYTLIPEGASLGSLHPKASAGDVRMPGVPTNYLGDLGAYLRGGGVGYYPSKNFVHLDTGRIRSWSGTPIKRKK